MATSITFNDGSPRTLTNGKPVPGDRFSNWTQDPDPVGEGANRQSDGALTNFQLREEYGVTFDLDKIPSIRVAGVAPVDTAARLVRHLINGGQCVVNTGDVLASSYATCGLKPGTRPRLVMSDKRAIEYTLSVHLINLAGSPAPMVCYYAEQ